MQRDSQISAGGGRRAEIQGAEWPSRLDSFVEKLSGWLNVEAGKSRKQKRTAKQMHADMVAPRYDGSYGRVAAFVRSWKVDRQREAQTSGRGTFVPPVFTAGDAFRFDWSEGSALLGSERAKLQVAHTKLSHSGAYIVRAYPLRGDGQPFLFEPESTPLATLDRHGSIPSDRSG